MNRILKSISPFLIFLLLFAGIAVAGSKAADHDMNKTMDMGTDMDNKKMNMDMSGRIGNLFHESMVNGYTLSYYLMDLRKTKGGEHQTNDMANSHEMNKMAKTHHIMVYIMDRNHAPVLKGMVGFLIKDAGGNTQKAMAMYMSKGFGITADMTQKGVYTITAKALFGDTKLMDNFEYEMK